jgi:hypothetical protein
MDTYMGDRTNKLYALANGEAVNLGHEYLGTEHLILALAKDPQLLPDEFIGKIGLDYNNIVLETKKRVRAGPDMLTIGKLPKAPPVTSAEEQAYKFFRERKGDIITPMDILVGLSEVDCVASQVLTSLGYSKERIRKSVFEMYGIRSEVNQDGQQSPIGYWPVSRKNMTLEAFLAVGGGLVECCSEISGATLFNDSSHPKTTIVSINGDISTVTLYYHPESPALMEKSLEVRELFDRAGVKYDEYPSREEVEKTLMEKTEELIERLKK